jgi:hypothetical protein
MSMMWIDVTLAIIDSYKKKGYTDATSGQYYWRKHRRILRNTSGDTVLVPGPVRIGNAFPTIQQGVDDWFKDLQRDIEKLRKKSISIKKIIFSGGGSIPIPQWFLKWCAEMGILIEVVDAKDVLQDGIGVEAVRHTLAG